MTLETDTAGNQLQEASDVKVRGVIVGDVREVEAERRGRHDRAGDQARVPRPDPGRRVGAAAAQDAVRRAVRRPRAAGGARPGAAGRRRRHRPGPHARTPSSCSGSSTTRSRCCRPCSPQDLSFTLGAVADALRGRGDDLGANLAATGEYFGEINTVLPELQADISELADFADTYDGAADDLLAVLDNLAVTNTTVVDQAGAAAPHVHRRHELVERDGRLPRDQRAEPDLAGGDVPAGARPLRRVLADLPLPARGPDPVRARGSGRRSATDGDPALNLNIQVTFPPRNPYVPGDQPIYADNAGPDCRGLDNIDGEIAAGAGRRVLLPVPAERRHRLRRRAPSAPSPRCFEGGRRRRRRRARASPGRQAGQSLPDVLAGSTAELDFVRSILALPDRRASRARSPTSPPPRLAPLLRGTR